jgi:hypothetical protein
MSSTPASRVAHIVSNETTLREKLATADARVIRLNRSINITSALTIPETKTVEFDKHMLYDEGGTVEFYGFPRAAERAQIFSGFSAGDIKGSFGGQPVYPEWWPMVDDNHDIAINCAIKASPVTLAAAHGIKVSLAAKQYDVSKPLDLRDSYSALIGAGMRATKITSTTAWAPTEWEDTNEWAAVASGNHAAMIWLGGTVPGANDYCTGISGATLECYNASRSNPTRWVSGVSGYGTVQEGSFAKDMIIDGASGASVGFPQHYISGAYQTATVNGFIGRNLWLTRGMKRTQIPILTTQHSNNCSFLGVTIDMRVLKQSSSAYAEAGGNDPTIYSAPAYVQDWPLYGVRAQGKSIFQGLHIEGCGHGVWVPQAAAQNHITIDGLDAYSMMDRGEGCIYSLDQRVLTAAPAANTDVWEYSSALLITNTSEGTAFPEQNFVDSVCVRNIKPYGYCTYAVRDYIYDQHISAYGRGQTPEAGVSGAAVYERGTAAINDPTPPYAVSWYDFNSPPGGTREFFRVIY